MQHWLQAITLPDTGLNTSPVGKLEHCDAESNGLIEGGLGAVGSLKNPVHDKGFETDDRQCLTFIKLNVNDLTVDLR